MTGVEVAVTEKLPGPAPLNCPKCSRELLLYTHAQARNIVCESCERLFEIRENGLLTVKHFQIEKTGYLIPIGTKGRINDIPYQVVGFILYQERDSSAKWREYLLFNPVSGYAFLSEYNGHWNYFHFISDCSNGLTYYKSLNYEGTIFNIFHKYHAKVVYAAGEFFWNITAGNPHYSEFIAPPYIITRIVSEKELSWLLGKYQEPEAIKEAFGIEEPMPERAEIGSTEVFSGGLTFQKIKKVTMWAAAVLLFMQILLSFSTREQTLAEATFGMPVDQNLIDPKPIVGPTFKLTSNFLHKSNVEFHLNAPVSNDWFAAGITLLNTSTGQEYDFEIGVEYYAGYESGEAWTEGSTRADQVLSALPDGEYQMFIRPYRSYLGTAGVFSLSVVQDVSLWSNFWIILLLLGVFPALQYYREENFEKRRWMNSDYSPYEY